MPPRDGMPLGPADPQDVLHSSSRALCPACHRLVDAERRVREGRVYLRKSCPTHGASEALVSGDAEWWTNAFSYDAPGASPLARSTSVQDGCPHDCGLCPAHGQHSCLPIVEITNRCDLDCPVCLVRNRQDHDMTVEEFAAIIEGLVVKEGTLDNVNLSGGEPTLHPRFFELCDLALRPEISRVSVVTNGLRVARDEDFCQELARRHVYVNLQFDGLGEASAKHMRGSEGLPELKLRALENLERAGVPTTLVCTVARGVNEDEVGNCVRMLLERDFILSLMFQPLAYTGSGGERFAPHDPLDVVTIPDVVRLIEEQSGGALVRGDFTPLPCSNPNCVALTYLLKTEDGFVPLGRFVDLEPYLRMIRDRGVIRPDAAVEDAFRHTINRLWSSAGQVPDCDRILRALKAALMQMFPPERALPLQERLRNGERMVKTIFIHAFMDAHTFDMERVRKCCQHYALPDGRLMPACVYNMFHRPCDPRPAPSRRSLGGSL